MIRSVSYGGGVQSTALLVLAAQRRIDYPLFLFANVGDDSENPATVRRLTPRECERLMGWPDDWTRWGGDGREVADSPRYALCGNGVVAPVAEWIGRRLP